MFLSFQWPHHSDVLIVPDVLLVLTVAILSSVRCSCPNALIVLMFSLLRYSHHSDVLVAADVLLAPMFLSFRCSACSDFLVVRMVSSFQCSKFYDVLIVPMFSFFRCSLPPAQGGTPEHDPDPGGRQEAAEELDQCLERLDLGAAAALQGGGGRGRVMMLWR